MFAKNLIGKSEASNELTITTDEAGEDERFEVGLCFVFATLKRIQCLFWTEISPRQMLQTLSFEEHE